MGLFRAWTYPPAEALPRYVRVLGNTFVPVSKAKGIFYLRVVILAFFLTTEENERERLVALVSWPGRDGSEAVHFGHRRVSERPGQAQELHPDLLEGFQVQHSSRWTILTAVVRPWNLSWLLSNSSTNIWLCLSASGLLGLEPRRSVCLLTDLTVL